MEILLTQPWRVLQVGCEWLLRALRYAQRRSREARPLFVGWLIVRRYSRHYRRAIGVYAADHGLTAGTAVSRVYDVGVHVVDGGAGAEPFGVALPPAFHPLVANVAKRAAAALDRSANCELFPAVAAASLTERTADVPAVMSGEVISIKLKDPFAIDGLRELCDMTLEPIERHIYRSYLVVDKVYVYRSAVSRQRPAASWLWHFDNHPREILKVMIYLTDVGEDTAPFEYLRDGVTGKPLLGSPIAPLHGDSRVPAEAVERRLAAGAEAQTITGPMGTAILFDDNVIHRGTLARRSHRDVVVLQIRPALFKAECRLDSRWSGTFAHRDFNRNPNVVAPQLRRRVSGGA